MTNQRVPDFVIVGAAKAATTWLQHSLQQHPGIFMPDPELHFFSREYDRGLDWYTQFFEAAEPDQLIGEKSNSYLDEPHAMPRLHEFAPNAKIIVQLRNPIERAYSDYCMLYRRGEVDQRIDYQLGSDGPKRTRLLAGGCYFDHITCIFDFYPREQVLVTLYDDIKHRAEGLLADVANHLGVTNVQPTTTRVKDKSLAMLPIRTRRLLRPFKPLVAPMRSNAWFKRLRAHFARPVAYPALPATTRARLGDYYREDVEKLSGILGRSLDHWLEPIDDAMADATENTVIRETA